MRNRGWILGLLVALAALATAGERIERFLPQGTFLYGGVEKLEAGYEKVMGELRRTLPDVAELQEDRFLRKLARELRLADVETREQFIAEAGLDPNGPAGIAWVMTDPTDEPGDALNENVLLILPVRDAAVAERLLPERILPELVRHADRQCEAARRRIVQLMQSWRRANPEAGDADITWQHLEQIAPGLKPFRCPCGGDYAFGAQGQEPICSVHGREHRAFEGPFTREGLGVRTVGGATLVGGRTKGIGYALTPTHLIVSNNMNVLEDALNAAAGDPPGAAMVPLAAGLANADGRAYVGLDYLFGLLRYEMNRSILRRGASPGSARFLELLASAGGLTGDLRIDGGVTGKLTWQIKRNPQSARALDKKPSKLEAFALVPDTALGAWGTNLTREAFSVIGDIALIEEPQLAGACKLVMAAADGDGAFALTQGTLGDEIPNLLFILRVRDREVAEAAAESWFGVFGRAFRPREREGGRPAVRRHQLGGVDVLSLEDLRRGAAFHYAFVGPWAVFGSNLDDLRTVIALHGGNGEKALAGSERYRKLGLPDGPANVISFLDMPALIKQMTAGHDERQQHWQNEACRRNMQQIERLIQQFRQQQGRLPATFAEFRQRGNLRDWCMMFGEQTKLLLDPATGKISCPAHGTVDAFKAVARRGPDREPREEEVILSAFGVWGLHIRTDGQRLVADGRLIPAPQRMKRRRPGPPPPPGPAEF